MCGVLIPSRSPSESYANQICRMNIGVTSGMTNLVHFRSCSDSYKSKYNLKRCYCNCRIQHRNKFLVTFSSAFRPILIKFIRWKKHSIFLFHFLFLFHIFTFIPSASNYYPVYAEVLYNFTAAGPQELGLEKGTLIEILRKEVGPWWFGLIKKEGVSLVEEILDPEMGWFPKEFVRVIQSPDTDAFYLEHITMQQIQHQHQRQHLQQNQQRDNERLTQQQPSNVSLSTSFTLTPSNTSLEGNTIGKPVIDHQHNNVTTIVIDSSTLNHTDTASNTATEIADCNSSRTNIDELDCSPIDTNISTTTQQTILYTSQSPNVVIGGIDILRRSAIKELLDTEVNYVKLLASICEGYVFYIFSL